MTVRFNLKCISEIEANYNKLSFINMETFILVAFRRTILYLGERLSMGMMNTLKGLFGLGEKKGNQPTFEQMIQSGNWKELTEEEMIQISAPSPVVEEVKIKRTVVEVLSKKTERKKGVNKLFHSAIVRLSDGNIIDSEDVSGDTAVKIGYHPAGYSLWNAEVSALSDGTYAVSWNSFNTCD